MTREEAITVLKGLSDNPLFSNQHRAAFNIAIHDIKAYYKWDLNELVLTQKDNEQEPKTGHWVDNPYAKDFSQCSECGSNWEKSIIESCNMDYCPNCGCRMVEPQESEG